MTEPPKVFEHEARTLEADEIAKLEADTELVSEFRRCKLEKDAKKNWDLFYKRNVDKFFRDRNWTTREFVELLDLGEGFEEGGKAGDQARTLNLLEAGCGVGNFIWPLIKMGLNYNFYATDFSPVALDIVKKNELFDEKFCHVFQSDLSQPEELLSKLPDPKARFHIVSLIFVLSAIHPDKMINAFKNIYDILHEDGILIFRDYGLYDYAMLRFKPGHKLADNFYVRQDGTRAYYFSLDLIKSMAAEAGFSIKEIQYVPRETVNVKEGLAVPRIFIQAKFCKSSTTVRKE